MASSNNVYVICEKTAAGHTNLVEAHTTKKAALAAASKLHSACEVKDLELKKAAKGGDASGGKVKTPKKAVNYAEDPDELAGDEDDLPEAAEYVEGAIPDALRGLNLLFTGTMENPRKKMEEIAKTYGAEIVKKLEDTDYVVVGTKPGAKKVAEIKSKNLETISETEFFDMLETGVPPEKRKRMAAMATIVEEDEGNNDRAPAKKQKK